MKAQCGCGAAGDGLARNVLTWMANHPCKTENEQIESLSDNEVRIGFQANEVEA